MDSEYTIAINNSDVLTKLCGTNDSNLRLIEENLGVSVYTQGNELSVNSENPDICRRFRFIIDRIIDEIEDGADDTAYALTSILNTGFSSTTSNASVIIIPGGEKRVYPKTINQAKYISTLRKCEMTLCTGPAGSGKTYIAIAEALRLVLTKKMQGVVLSRPVVEAGESLGYLPGDMEQKIMPYLRPLYDAMESFLSRESVHRLVNSGIIEIAPLAYMRGRTFNNKILVLDEAQNATTEQLKMFITRMGFNSKVFVTGDITQIDLPKKSVSGLVRALSVLSTIPEIGIVQLKAEDVVRNPLVKKIVQAYENDKDC